MELPKNITQIGESDRRCKIYVEDYVISYIKQMNRHAMDKEIAVALYGNRKEEAGVVYLFLYGAAKLNFLNRESRHLSQAQMQEIERQRRKFFPEYAFMGYRILNGEMVEGFHVYEQEVCRYITGYAQFYEKNDSMLAYMLEERQEDAKPEEVDREKYETVKRRQEERRAHAPTYREVQTTPQKSGMRTMKLTAAAMFALLCVAGLATMGGGEKLKELQVAARQMMEEVSEQQLPDAVPAAADSAHVGTVIAEDKLTEALREENSAAEDASLQSGLQITPPPVTPAVSGPETTPQLTAESVSTPVPTPRPIAEPTSTPVPTPEPTPVPTAPPVPTPEPTPQPVSYTIKRGDTLIGICIAKYGSDARVAEVCDFNNIDDPDDIKVGQKIFLP